MVQSIAIRQVRRNRLDLLCLALVPWLHAQNAADPQETYAKLCAGCHGADALGSQQGPGLAGNPGVRRRSAQNLRNVIVRGIPAAGMPGFPLPDATLDALVDLVRSLNALAADSQVPGDRQAGKAFFFGKGQCSSCHMVYASGEPVGPDLSNIARELTVEELRQALLRPGARTAPGYEMARVRLGDGRTLRGFVRSRTRFDLQLQDLNGGFHSVPLDRVSSIDEEKQSHMPPLQASGEELQNLLAYLSGLTGVKPGAPTSSRPAAAGGVDFARILNPRPEDWITYNGNVSGNRYSPLKQVNTTNVSKLALRWTYSIPLWQQFLPDTPYYHENMRYFGLETVPIVADGIMYVTGPNQVHALDARSGHLIWQYSRPRTPGIVSDASLGTNRGVAILGDAVFMTTDNAHLIALHRVTGRLLWEVVMPGEAMRYGSTVAPLIVKDMVLAGVSGGDWGIRGFLAAYKASNGERVWRRWTIPAQGEPGFDTWKGSAVKEGGGGTWLTGAYDQETDTVYWATGNPYPNSDDSQRGGDNLFTNCVLALHPATGEVKWYYQFTPHDTHDWDANTPLVVVNAKYRGQDRKLLLHADRNGFFYVFDRADGKLLLARPFVKKMTWASGIDHSGRPVVTQENEVVCPDTATNWNGTAYSPATRLYYVMAIEKCQVRLAPGSWKKERPMVEPARKYLRAIDIETGNIAWEIPETGPTDGKRVAGILGTAGGILFYGDPSGEFLAVDERDGRTLWRIPLNATMKTSPMTYAVDGEQHVTVAVGSNIMTFALPR
jgi:PQQ-dependent dehydrogenase (methanol/ethanol family)